MVAVGVCFCAFLGNPVEGGGFVDDWCCCCRKFCSSVILLDGGLKSC